MVETELDNEYLSVFFFLTPKLGFMIHLYIERDTSSMGRKFGVIIIFDWIVPSLSTFTKVKTAI